MLSWVKTQIFFCVFKIKKKIMVQIVGNSLNYKITHTFFGHENNSLKLKKTHNHHTCVLLQQFSGDRNKLKRRTTLSTFSSTNYCETNLMCPTRQSA